MTLPLHTINTREYRERVKIQRPVNADQIDHTDDANWVEQCSPHSASVQPTGGREVLRGDQQVGVETHTVKLRFDEQTQLITHRMRFVWDGRKLNIEAPPVNVKNADVELQFSCREVIPEVTA